jgi:uncharacterized protein YndB with AHSA1/START domain
MTVLKVDKDLDTFSLTLTAEFAASVEQVWELWQDPRKLEKWWGPPQYPATFETFDLTPGGDVTYFMTGPEGERYHGYWSVTEVDPPKLLTFDDGFAHADGTHNSNMPTSSGRVDLVETDSGTLMTIRSTTESREHLETLISMGMIEGITAAVGQMDALLV